MIQLGSCLPCPVHLKQKEKEHPQVGGRGGVPHVGATRIVVTEWAQKEANCNDCSPLA